MHKILVPMLLLVSFGHAQEDAKVARITGQVVSQEGRLVANVKVIAEEQGVSKVYVDRFAMTDAGGHFTIDRLAYGKYAMVPEKPSDGYPRLPPCFYGAVVSTITVTLTADDPLANANIQLPPKAAKLTGEVSNSETGEPIRAGIRVTSRSDTGCWIGMGVAPKYSLQVPSGVDIDLTAEADGYADWSYSEAFNGAALNLEPGESAVLNIKLKPRSDRNSPR